MDRDRAVVVPGGGDAVDADDAVVVRLEVARRVVDRDRPERVDRDVADVELVAADGESGLDVEVERLALGEAAPAAGGAD